MTLDEQIDELIANSPDDQIEPHLRFVIWSSQLGQLARHLTHDQKIHPKALPLNELESDQAADAFIQMCLYFRIRGLSIDKALELGVARVKEHVWSKQAGSETRMVSPGRASGVVVIIHEGTSIYTPLIDNKIVSIEPSRFKEILDPSIAAGYVFNKAAYTSHAAIMCRELNIPAWSIGSDKDITSIRNATHAIMNDNSIALSRGDSPFLIITNTKK